VDFACSFGNRIFGLFHDSKLVCPVVCWIMIIFIFGYYCFMQWKPCN